MTSKSTIIHHVYPGPHRTTGIRSYALLLERMLASHAQELSLDPVDLEGQWWRTLPPQARVLVQLGRNEGEMHWFLRESARLRPDLRRTVLIHDPPEFSIEKWPWMRRIGTTRWGRGLRRGVNALFGDAIDRSLVMEGDVFLAMSEGGCEAVRSRMAKLGKPNVIVFPVPHGLYLDEFEPIQASEEGRGTLRIGFFGYISPSKGIGILLDAGRILLDRDEYRNRVSFRISGNPDSDHSEALLRAQVREIASAGLSDRMEFLPGPSDGQLPELIRGFDLLALPYLRPGSHSASGPLHWAWTMGIPAIANSNPYFVECLGSTCAGIVVDPPTGEAWAKALTELLDDHDRLATLRANAAEQRRLNSWPCVARRFVEVLGRNS